MKDTTKAAKPAARAAKPKAAKPKAAGGKSAAGKPAAKKPASASAAKPAAKKVAQKAAPAKAAASATSEVTVLRKKELLARVVEASGVKKKDAKSVVEATLKVLGDALTKGEMLVLPPFGKARVNRQKDLASGEMLVVKLRRGGEGGGEGGGGKGGGGKGGQDDLADEDD